MKKERKVFNLYNFVVIICLIVIGGSIYVIMNKNDNVGVGIKEKIGNLISSAGEAISGLTGGKKEESTDNKQNDTRSTNTNSNASTSTNTGTNQSLETNIGENYSIQAREETNPNNDTNSNTQEISEARAKEIALNEFIKLGEADITIDNLNVIGILRGGERYLEVSSNANSVEINIKTGKVERINNEQV